MNRKTFLLKIASAGAIATFSPTSLSGAENKSVVAGFNLSKKIFEVGKEYDVSINFPSNLKDKVAKGFLTVVGDDGASEIDGTLFNRAFGTPLNFKLEQNRIVFKVKFGREQCYCFRIFEKKIPKDTPSHLYPKTLAVLHAYALNADMLSLIPLRGDFHIHSTRSDGKDTPENVALRNYECGFDFQSLSDHGRYQPSVDMKNLFEPFDTSMAFYCAEECHRAHPHIHNIGATESVTKYIDSHIPQFYRRVDVIMKDISDKEFTFRERKDIAKIQAECEIIRKLGGLAVFNHPYWSRGSVGSFYYNQMPKKLWDEVCKRKIFDVYELINYGCAEMSISRALINYAELRAQGIKYPVIGTSDGHDVRDQGQGYSIVFASSNSIADIKDAIMNHRSIAVVEYACTNATEKGRIAPLAYGDDRYVRFAYFLFDYYFPEHSKLIQAQGKILREIMMNKKDTKENRANLKKYSELAKNSYKNLIA